MPPDNINNSNTNKLRIDINPVFKNKNNSAPQLKEENTANNAYNVLNNQAYVPKQNPVSAPTNLNTTNKKSSIIRTFQGDMASAIQADHLSSINIAIAENQKNKVQVRETNELNTPNSYSFGKIIIFISFILILIGSGLIAYLILRQNGQVQQTKITTFPALITTDFTEELNLNTNIQNNFTNILVTKLFESSISDNSFYNCYLTVGTSTDKRLITSTEFINLSKHKIPDMVKRVLTKDFMVGTYFFNNKMPFIILKTNSFENTYAGMFDWEKDLEKDLQTLFRLSGYEENGGILAGLNPTISKKFEDAVIANKDVRLLRDENFNIMLLYGIIDNETLIITTSDIAFKEIINRLNQENSFRQ